MKVFIFDRDDTLTFDSRGRNSLINPNLLIPLLETINANPDMQWAIASASATGVNQDPAWELIQTAAPGIDQPIYAPVKRGLDGLSSRIHTLNYREFVNVNNKDISMTDLKVTALEALLTAESEVTHEDATTVRLKLKKGTTREPFSFDFTFGKQDKVIFQLGHIEVTMSVDALRQHRTLLSNGDYKLFSILNTLDRAKVTIDISQAPGLRELGVTAIKAPAYYTTVKPEDVIFCDDKAGCYEVAKAAGFHSILANSSHASYLKGEGGTSQQAPDNSYLKEINAEVGTIVSSQIFLKSALYVSELQSLIVQNLIYKRGRGFAEGVWNKNIEIGGKDYLISSKNADCLNDLVAMKESRSITAKDISRLISHIDKVLEKEKSASSAQAHFYEALKSYLVDLNYLFDKKEIHHSSGFHDIIHDLRVNIQQAGINFREPYSQEALVACLTSKTFSHDFSKLISAAVKHDKTKTPEEEQASFSKHAFGVLTKLAIDFDALVADPRSLQRLLTEATFRRLAFTQLTADASPLMVSGSTPTSQRIGMQRIVISSSVSVTPRPVVALEQLMNLVDHFEQGKIQRTEDITQFLSGKATNIRSLLANALPELRDVAVLKRMVACQPLIDALAGEYALRMSQIMPPSTLSLRDQALQAGMAGPSSSSSAASSELSSSSGESISSSSISGESKLHH